MMLIFLFYTCVLFVANTSPGSAQDIRLVDGSTNNEGRVEVLRSGQWQTVCHSGRDDGWDLNDADVACRQLGYGYAIRAVNDAKFGKGTGGQWEASFSCTGRESGLEYCSTSSSSCTHNDDVGVICSTSSRQQGSLRLAGSSFFPTSLYAGRLEIFVNGEWGTVCDDGWGDNEANVACKQMGFMGASDSNWILSFGGSSSQTIWLDDVTCTGSESQLINCNHGGLGVENCGHIDDIGIQCTHSVTSTLTPATLAGIIVGSFFGAVFLCCYTCIIICCVAECCTQRRMKTTTRPVRAPVTTTAGNTVAVAMVNQQPQQQGGYPHQPDYQQQQGGYPPQPDYQQQQEGYPPQPDYQQQEGGYPPQPDYQQQFGYPGEQADPVPSHPQPTDPLEDEPPPYAY